jgi:hypothetical protein
LLPATAAEIHPILCPGAEIVITVFLLDVGIGIADALAMFRAVLPIIPWSVDIDRAIYDDVVTTPVAAAAPIVSA